MKKGSKFLKVTSILEIITGIVSILLIRFLLVQDDSTIIILSKEIEITAIWGLIMIYGVNIFKIIAGILGLCFANKKSVMTIICGILLVSAHSTNMLVGEFSVIAIILDILPILIPSYYLYGAVLNYRNQK